MPLKNKERPKRKNDSRQVSSLLRDAFWQCHGSSMGLHTRVQRSNEPPFLFRQFNGDQGAQLYQYKFIENTKTFCDRLYQRCGSRFISTERQFTQAMVSVVGNFTSGAAYVYRDEDQQELSFIKVIDLILKKHSPAVWGNRKEREYFHAEFARSYFTGLDVGKASKAVFDGRKTAKELSLSAARVALLERDRNANQAYDSSNVRGCMASVRCGSR